MLQWLSGRPLAEKILTDLRNKIAKDGRALGLAAIAVGNDPASQVYLRLKEQACQKVGINFEKHYFTSATEEEILKLILSLNERAEINGILLQLPLPDGINPDPLIATIDPIKDVDGFSTNTLVPSPLLRGAGELLKTITDPTDKQILIIAKSQVFLTGAQTYFQNLGSQVQTHQFRSGTTPIQTETAEIIFTAVGQPGCLTGSKLKKGVIILDAGFKLEADRSLGDLDSNTAQNPAITWATPVPGGLGPLTVAMLLQNIWDLTQKQKLP